MLYIGSRMACQLAEKRATFSRTVFWIKTRSQIVRSSSRKYSYVDLYHIYRPDRDFAGQMLLSYPNDVTPTWTMTVVGPPFRMCLPLSTLAGAMNVLG